MAKKTNYVVWFNEIDHDAVTLESLPDFDTPWKLNSGESLVGEFPKNPKCVATAGVKKPVVPDSVANIDSVAIVSARMKAFFEEHDVSAVEYFPVAITLKGKPVDGSYFLMHHTSYIDCIDVKKSARTVGENKRITRLKSYVIDEAKIGAKRTVFRPLHFSDYPLVHRTLADAMTEEGFTGIRWTELADLPELLT